MAYNGELHVMIDDMDNTVGSLTQPERSMIIGCLLGDGYLRIVPGRRNALLEINHSVKAKEYVDYKYDVLKRICVSPPKERSSGSNGRRAYRFYTKQHQELTELYKLFYKNGRKTIPQDLELDPVSLAVWYMDDGSRSRASDIYLNTQQFSLADQRRLLAKLRKLGIKARLNKDKKYYRIRLLKESIPVFMKFIQPHIVPSMLYKLVMTP
jgi:hypothetical protein